MSVKGNLFKKTEKMFLKITKLCSACGSTKGCKKSDKEVKSPTVGQAAREINTSEQWL